MNTISATYESKSIIRKYARILYENYRVDVMASRKTPMPEWNQASVYERREFINEAEQAMS